VVSHVLGDNTRLLSYYLFGFRLLQLFTMAMALIFDAVCAFPVDLMHG